MRANRYFVAGAYKMAIALNKNRQYMEFNLALEVYGIKNETTAEAILQTIRIAAAEKLAEQSKQPVKPEQLSFTCIGMIDSFEQPEETPAPPEL